MVIRRLCRVRAGAALLTPIGQVLPSDQWRIGELGVPRIPALIKGLVNTLIHAERGGSGRVTVPIAVDATIGTPLLDRGGRRLS